MAVGLAIPSFAAVLTLDERDATKPDCGLNALFILLHMEKKPITLTRLASLLPQQTSEGYSMAELSDSAHSLGLELEGVNLSSKNAPERPAIVLLKGKKGGHFAVVIPVGTLGKMVQIIDPPSAPRITDYERLTRSKAWTGKALVTKPPFLMRWNYAPILISAAIFLLGFALWLWKKDKCSRAEATQVRRPHPPEAADLVLKKE